MKMDCKGLITLCLLTGGCKGKLLEWPSNETVVEGERVTLPCQTDLEITVFWNFNNDDIFYARHISSKYVNQFDVEVNISYGVHNLVIQNATGWHNGLYTCIDDDGDGEKRSAWLNVTSRPSDDQTSPGLAINPAVIAIPVAMAVVIVVIVAISLIVCHKLKRACFSKSTETIEENSRSANELESNRLLSVRHTESVEIAEPPGQSNTEESGLTAENENSVEDGQTTQNNEVEQNGPTNSNPQHGSDISDVTSPEEKQQGQRIRSGLKPKPTNLKGSFSGENQSVPGNHSPHAAPIKSESSSEENEVAVGKVNLVEVEQKVQNQETEQLVSMASPPQQSSESPEIIFAEEKQQGSVDETRNHNSTNVPSPIQLSLKGQLAKPEIKPKPNNSKCLSPAGKQSICKGPDAARIKSEPTSVGNKSTAEKDNVVESKQEAQNEVNEQLGSTASQPQHNSDSPENISSEEIQQDSVNLQSQN